MSSQRDSGSRTRGRADLQRLRAISEEDIARDAAAERAELGIDADRLEFYPVIPLPVPDVRTIRTRLRLTQIEFASQFGLRLRTIQQWEQGRTKPDQPARVLLRTIAVNPEAVAAAVWSIAWHLRHHSAIHFDTDPDLSPERAAGDVPSVLRVFERRTSGSLTVVSSPVATRGYAA